MPKKQIPDSRLKLLVAGTFQDSEGYPNVRHKIEIMASDERYETLVVNQPVSLRVNYQSTASRIFSLLRIAMGLSFNSVSVIFKIFVNREVDVLYIPYPAVHIAWLLGLLPSKIRPRIIVIDAFISLYDTVVVDRELVKVTSVVARLLHGIERRAFIVATTVLTDTEENADYYSKIFAIPREKYTALPLSIDEEAYNIDSHSYPDRTIQSSNAQSASSVLFVGTMVPLHGVDYVCRAIQILSEKLSFEKEIVFTFIGSGQVDDVLDEFLSNKKDLHPNIQFRREKNWMSTNELSREIKNADLCLGIFGRKGKSDRVWPYKNYCYLACGKPVITGETSTSIRLAKKTLEKAFVPVDTSDPGSLAQALVFYLSDKEKLSQLGQQANQLYSEHLSHAAVTEKLDSLFRS